MDFEDLSVQILILIGSKLTSKEIEELCFLSSKLNEKICLSENLWERIYLERFKFPSIEPLIWREAYHQKTYGGSVYAFGLNEYGQLGLRDQVNRDSPIKIFIGNKFKSISGGFGYSLILSSEGQVYGFGLNSMGQLGLGNLQNHNYPELIPFPEKIIAISAGQQHSLILTFEGQVYAFGRNQNGQLGLGDYQDRYFPERISFGLEPEEKIIAISAGAVHSLLLSSKGQVYSFGENRYGQLGSGDRNPRSIPEPILIKNKIIAISTWEFHNLILTDNGEVYGFGENSNGELGLGDTQNHLIPEKILFRLNPKEKITAISTGASHSLILAENGSVYAFGSNESGQLGLGDFVDRHRPEKIPLPDKIIAISAGGTHSLILSSRYVYSFGDNRLGELGLGDKIDRNTPEPIPFDQKISSIFAGGFFSLILTSPLVLFSTIQTLIQKNWVKNYSIKYPTSTSTVLMEFTDKDDNSYLIEVQWNPQTNQIFELIKD